MLASTGFEIQQYGDGRMVVRQVPPPATRLPAGAVVKLSTSEATQGREGFVTVPDVRRMSIRRALNRLTMEELDVSITGSGVVVEQFPGPHQRVKVGTRITIKCAPRQKGLVAVR
jgi:beta-lactam-binding protein with PASTA domain